MIFYFTKKEKLIFKNNTTLKKSTTFWLRFLQFSTSSSLAYKNTRDLVLFIKKKKKDNNCCPLLKTHFLKIPFDYFSEGTHWFVGPAVTSFPFVLCPHVAKFT